MRRLILATLLVLLAAPPALGQPQVQVVGTGRMIAGNNTSASGASIFTGVAGISDTLTNQGAMTTGLNSPTGMAFTAESTGVFPSAGYKEIVLHARVFPFAPMDTTSKYTYAIACKCFQSDGSSAPADSNAGLPWRIEQSAGLGDGAVPPAGTGTGVWPGEFTETFDPWVGRSSATGKSNASFGLGGRDIPLSLRLGPAALRCTHMQVRARCISGNNASATTKAWFELRVMGFN